MKRIKLLITAFALLGASQTWAQTDVTSTYLTNADFEKSTPINSNLKGYGKDGTPYGFQSVDGWTSVVTNGDNSNKSYPNSGMGGAVFAYGSSYQLQGNNKAAPATNPSGEATGNCLGFFAVWGLGGYYYQNVTLAAGKYTITVPIYNQSGTQANTTYTGFFPNSGTNRTVAINPAVGQWSNQAVTFTLTEDTPGQIRVGYQSTGSGSGANPHIFIDGVKIEFTASVVKDVLETAITAATKANETLNNSELAAAIADAQTVFDNENATQDQVNAAAATLNTATELAMSAAGDVTEIFLTNADMSSTSDWTAYVSSQFKDFGSYQIGGSQMVRFAAPTADETHLTSEYAFGFECRWSTNYASFNQTTDPMPAGVYTFTFDVENVNGATTKASYNNLFYVQVGDTRYTDTKTEWMNGKSSWTNHSITVTLNEASPVTISLGYGTGNNNIGADNTPAIYASHLKLNYKSFLAGAKEAYDNAVLAAGEAKTNNPNVTGEELTALNSELGKAEPTTVDGYNAAAEAIQNATTTLIAAASSYNALVSINDMITATGTLKYADAEKKPAANVTATSAADAATKTASQTAALRAYYESHALAEGVNGAVNMTSSITNANNPGNNDGWTWTGNKNNPRNNEPWTDADGTNTHSYFDGGNWGGTSWTTTMEQNILLPAGNYLLTAKGRSATNTSLTMSICGKSVELPHVGSTGNVFDRGWGDASVEFTTDGTGATILVTATAEPIHEWFSVSDFRLVQLSFNADAYASTSEDYDALNDAITSAEGKELGFENGQYAPYSNVAAIEALAAAKAIDQEAQKTNLRTTIAEVTSSLTNAIWTANDGDVDAIYNGNFAENLTGWTRTNGWGQQQTGLEGDYATAYYNQPGSLKYGDTGFYTMPLAENTIYKFTMAFRSHEANSNNAMNVSILNENSEGLAKVNLGYNKSKDNWKTVTIRIKTGAAGNYVANLENDGNTWMTGVSLVKDNQAADITIDEAAESKAVADPLANVTLTRTLSNLYWNTFSVPFNAEIPEGWTVMEFKSAENNVISFSEASSLEAGKPYLVKPENVVTNPVFENVVVESIDGQTVGEGDYKFVAQIYNKSLATDGTVAYLATDGKVKKLTSGGIKGLRAYFTIPANVPEARIAFIDFDGDTTGISEKTMKVNEGIIYDLNGRRVENMGKGIYVVNGKKIVK
ncbi:hypothetical protein L6475_02290 [Prevotella sp. E9-3]|uniref:hypothetical protein n=1 Tax=Prevotella sp. E9-3 TaxID=2913621 RepID=UPI001EDC447A|nr:hypothetical protein [Prevotella sp. E9-3]UKK48823.1 hypothetical protein L6475_02290 [Prevotella sp. E9-3]